METKNQLFSTVISTQILTENHSLGTAQIQGCEESYMTLESKKHVKIYHLNKKKQNKNELGNSNNTNPLSISNIELYEKVH